jgi:hypothetical protein
MQSKPNSVLESLTYVPGLVGDIVEHIVANAHRPNRVFALGAAVSVVGTLISRRAVGPIGNPTHLYTLIVGPTGIGKDCPRRAVAQLIEAAGARVHRGDFASLASLNQALASTTSPAAPIAAVVIDEIFGFLARAVNTRDRRLADKLCASWDSTWGSTSAQVPSEQGSSDQASSDQASSDQASLPFSLFGTARDGEFWPLLRGTRIRSAKAGQGAGREFIDDLFSRFLIFESAGWAPAEQSPSISDPVLAAGHKRSTSMKGVAQPDDSNARFEAQLNDRFEGAVDVRAAKSKYLKRVPEHAIRLATTRAVGRAGHRAKVDAADMTWGADLAMALVANTMERARERPPVRTAPGTRH